MNSSGFIDYAYRNCEEPGTGLSHRGGRRRSKWVSGSFVHGRFSGGIGCKDDFLRTDLLTYRDLGTFCPYAVLSISRALRIRDIRR